MGAVVKAKEKVSVKHNSHLNGAPSARVKRKEKIAEALEVDGPVISKLSRDEIDKLVVDNREDARRMAWRLLSSWRVRMHDDDVMSVVGMALCDAANRFDPDRGVNFKTFFFYHLRGMLIKEITAMFQAQKSCDLVSPEMLSDVIPGEQQAPAGWFFKRIDVDTPERIMQRREVASMFQEACEQLDPLEKEVVERSFFGDEQLVDIADELGYCRCHISRVKSRAVVMLRKMLRRYQETEMEGMTSQGNGNDTTARSKKYTGGRGRRKHKAALLAKSA